MQVHTCYLLAYLWGVVVDCVLCSWLFFINSAADTLLVGAGAAGGGRRLVEGIRTGSERLKMFESGLKFFGLGKGRLAWAPGNI